MGKVSGVDKTKPLLEMNRRSKNLLLAVDIREGATIRNNRHSKPQN